MTNPLDDPAIAAIANRGSISDREMNKFDRAIAMSDPEQVHVIVDNPADAGSASEGTLAQVRDAIAGMQNEAAGGDSVLRTILFLNAAGDVEYACFNQQDVAIATATWTILKLFYDASANLVDKQVLVGSVTGRAALSWKTSQGD